MLMAQNCLNDLVMCHSWYV